MLNYVQCCTKNQARSYIQLLEHDRYEELGKGLITEALRRSFCLFKTIQYSYKDTEGAIAYTM